MTTTWREDSEHDTTPEPQHVCTGFLESRSPMRIVCALCVREHHDQSHPLLSTKHVTQVHLRCDECMRYVDTDLDFAFRR